MRPLALLLFPVLLAAQPSRPLFDGKTLNGWEQRNGTATYKVENGVLVGTTAKGSPNSFLCTARPYGDFVLEWESLNNPALNSGVQIRSHQYERDTTTWVVNNGRHERKFPAGRVHGYQVEISMTKSANSGGIYDEARRGWLQDKPTDPAAAQAFHDNQWNRFRVEAIGAHIRTWVNGANFTDLVDPVDQSGLICLQVHQNADEKPLDVRWRNLKIQDLGTSTWTSIFDGKSMNGWKKVGGGNWEVTAGALRGTVAAGSPDRGFLMSEQSYKDVVVRLKYKVLKGNSGFFFRMADPPAKPLGYEVEVDPTRDAGSLQEVGGRGWVQHTPAELQSQVYQAGEWNEMVVTALGRRIVIHINGTKTAEFADDPGPAAGRFGLQLNPKQDLEVWFKDIAVLHSAKR